MTPISLIPNCWLDFLESDFWLGCARSMDTLGKVSDGRGEELLYSILVVLSVRRGSPSKGDAWQQLDVQVRSSGERFGLQTQIQNSSPGGCS